LRTRQLQGNRVFLQLIKMHYVQQYLKVSILSFSIVLPDGSKKDFEQAPSILDVANSISERLGQQTVGGQLNGTNEIVDLRTTLADGTNLKIITTRDEESLHVIRHSAAHIMAQAVQELWPEIKVTFGPSTDMGFFYDFDAPKPFEPADMEAIEVKMKEIVKRDLPITLSSMKKADAHSTFTGKGERFKAEHIDALALDEVSIYTQGDWFDLCAGPHVQRTGQVKAVKVLSLAGAYWKGDENNPMLQRVYGTAFYDKKELKQHLLNLEEAKKRDHRKLGKELGLFHFDPISPGAPFFTAKGATVYRELVDYMRSCYKKYDYQEVITPMVYDVDLYHQSGHYENYKENMYFMQIDEREFSAKPMNCPGHCKLYGFEQKSYRDLPWRIADFGRLHRYERSGAMHGLTRVRTFCQDDAHIFCAVEQMQDEIKSFMTFLDEVYNKLGMSNYKVYLSTRPEKRMGSDEVWDRSEGALKEALETLKIPYTVNPGDGAFYGPKLDIMFVDAIKRPWQLGTLQCDFNLPESFDLKFVGSDNESHRPVMLHRAILGSLERFMGVYIEHCAGRFPTWLSPEQVTVINISDAQKPYCNQLMATLDENGVRTHLDDRNEKLGFKIREAQLRRASYILVVGDKEVESEVVTVRLPNGESKHNIPVSEFISKITGEIGNRSLDSAFID
jgi:threonyl-tRNA synthetase